MNRPTQRDNGSPGLTIGVGYNKHRHRTEFTVRMDGKIIDDNYFSGELTEQEIQKIIEEINRKFG